MIFGITENTRKTNKKELNLTEKAENGREARISNLGQR